MAPGAELGETLRFWRDRADPGSVGLPAGGLRRAAGLRREELATLAGLSVDYVVRLEQGRARHPSEQVLSALSRALRLTVDERDHLFRLAGAAVPEPGLVPDQIPPSVQRMLDRLADVPVSVHDASWTLLAWNPMWAALMGDPSGLAGRSRNMVWRHFVSAGGSRTRMTPEQLEAFEHNMVADLRTTTARFPADRTLRELVAELQRQSPRFAELWAARVVEVHRSARKSVEHPSVGLIALDCDILTVADSELRIIAYTAEPGSEDADKLELVRVLGTQELTPR
jgi:transcriptional regulator with XRE-family HTH domain